MRASIALLSTIALFVPTAASAQAVADGIYEASHAQAGDPGAIRVDDGVVRLGAPMPAPVETRLESVENGNQHYQLAVTWERPSCPLAVLVLGGHAQVWTMRGRGRGRCTLGFSLDARQAAAVAQLLGVRARDRSAVGAAVTGTFSTDRAVYRAGQSVELRLRLRNPRRAPAVQRQVGGLQRGPRNQRFELVVYRDGQRLATIPATSTGGISSFLTLRPGGTGEVSERVGRWADVSRPGHYRVECAYRTTLVPAGVDASEPGATASRWDRTFRGQVQFEVR